MSIQSYRHMGLKELLETGKSRKVNPDLRKRARDRLSALNAARDFSDLDQPGFAFHLLKGQDRYAISVSGPWRITFEWSGGHAYRVDLEQYH